MITQQQPKQQQRTSTEEEELGRKVAQQLLDDLPEEELEKALEQLAASQEEDSLLLSEKIKIEPSKEQETILWQLAENCRLIYNFGLMERLEWWGRNRRLSKQQREKAPTFKSQSKQLPQIKQEFPRYQQNYSKTLQETLKRLDADFRSFYALRKLGYEDANPPRFKGKKYFTTICYNQSGFKIDADGCLSFSYFALELEEDDQIGKSKLKKKESKRLHFLLPAKFQTRDWSDYTINQVEIFQEHKTKEFFVSIAYQQSVPSYHDNGVYQAIDLGVDNLIAAINSHAGKAIIEKNARFDKYWQPKIEELQSKRDHCKKKSNRWHRYNNKLRKNKKKLNNQTKNFQHHISKKVVTHSKANTFIVGDLQVKEMTASKAGDTKADKSRHRSCHNSGALSRFPRFLAYKAKKQGKKVIRISERNTSKRCAFCGSKKNRPLAERVIICDNCRLKINRDVNAAVNLLQRFFALLSLERPVVGQQLLKTFREQFFATHSPGIFFCPKS